MVLLISIPLSMGIAIASGVPPAYGLVTAAIGGLVTGSLAGCPLQITGPSAGLAVMIMDVVKSHGLDGLYVAVPIAGGLQVVAGRLRLGQLFRAVSPAVIRGMLAGIGVLIFASQFHVMVDDTPKDSGLENLYTIPWAVWKGVTPGGDANHQVAAAVGLLTLTVIVMIQVFRERLPRNLQAPLVAVVVATAVAQLLSLDIKYVSLGGNPFTSLALPGWSMVTAKLSWPLVGVGCALGFVASAETLLCSTAVDQMRAGSRTDYDQELFAQGMGNLLAGCVGVLPTTGVITRSTANVQAGAQTRRAAVLYGAGLLLLVSLLPGLLETIPTASLAGVLVYIGYKLVSSTPLETLRRYGRSEVAIYGVTVAAIVGIDLLKGLMIGFALSIGKLLYTFSHLEARVERTDDGQTHIHLDGSATFMRLPRLAAFLDQVSGPGVFHVHIQDLDYIDHACLDLLAAWEAGIERAGGRAFIEWSELAGKYHRKNQRVDPSATALPREEAGVSSAFEDAVAEAEVRDLGEEVDFRGAVGEAASLLARPLGTSPEEVAEELERRVQRGGCVVLRGIAIPHLHAPDLAHPVVVLARSRVGIPAPEGLGEETVHGFFFLVSPEERASLHLHMLSQLARRIGDSAFLDRWLSAPGEQDLRECLLTEQRILTLTVRGEGPTREIAGLQVRELSAREDCVVSLVIRDGEPRATHGGTTLEEGDQVVLIGGTSCIQAVRERYGLEDTAARAASA